MNEVARESRGGWSRAAEPAGAALLLALAVVALRQSWNRWLDPIIDTGRDLYVAEALHRGLVLYRDFRYNYPPLAPLLLSSLTRLFGSDLATFAAIGIATGFAVAALLYAIVRPLAGAPAAFAATLLFVALNFTGASTWGCNFVFPYAYAATFGILFFLVGLERLLAFVRSGSSLAFAIAVIGCAAASLSKIEFAAASAIVLIVAVAIRRPSPRGIASALIASLVPTGICAAAVRGVPLSTIRQNLFSGSLLGSAQASAFYAQVTGSAWSASAVLEVATGAALVGAFVVLLYFVDRQRRNSVAVAMIVAAIAIVSVAAAENHFFRAWTLLQPVALVALLLRDRKSPLLVLLAGSIAVTSRVYLNISPEWYGFAFDVPLYALIAVVFFDTLPRLKLYPRGLSLLWLPLFALLAFRGLEQQHERYAMKRFPIVTPRGTLLDYNRDRAPILNSFLQSLAASRPKSMVVIPEGITLNYFASVGNPLSFYLFTPVETGNSPAESEIVREMESRPPELIVFVSRNLAEYGSRGFGIDYDVALRDAIARQYAVSREWHASRFSLVVLKRR